jgi:hypothetical protein
LVYEVRHPWEELKKTKIEFIKNKNEYWSIPQSVLSVNDQMQQVWGGWIAE